MRKALIMIAMIIVMAQVIHAKAYDIDTYKEANYYYAAVVKFKEKDLRREFYVVTIFLPIVLGLVLPTLKLSSKVRNVYVVIASVIASALALYVAYASKFTAWTLLDINRVFSIGFKIDGLTKVFLLIIAVLWPIAVLYATEYMEHEENQDSFFRYYLIAFGIAIGLSFSRNVITMYLFYELLTFLTLPLIMHDLYDRKTLYAGKVYLIVSVLGASIALIGIIILTTQVSSVEFIYGGHIKEVAYKNNELLINIAYILCFIGFGVKAAILPFTYWLPTCGVAPTPVSALLHAVAVVKAGVFAIMRVTYYLFGNTLLVGSIAQKSYNGDSDYYYTIWLYNGS